MLKCHIHKCTKHFLKINLKNNTLPCITRLTHITKTTATLIDNIFVSNTLHTNIESVIIITDVPNHLPSICLLTPLLCMAPCWGHNNMCVQFFWPHHGAMIYSLTEHSQIVWNSIQLSSIITTDISVDVTTS